MARESNIESLDEVVLGENATPRWVVVSSFFRWFMEYSGELLKLVVAEFGRTAGTRFVVDHGVEAALFEAV